jgi:hypothetical protein
MTPPQREKVLGERVAKREASIEYLIRALGEIRRDIRERRSQNL